MIVRAESNRLLLIRQSDHAHLSGRLAAAWGRPPWDVPSPFPQVTLGARLHDDAWEPFDEAPDFRDGRPLAFQEVDRIRTSALYRDGASAVSTLDPYAGLMASLHYSGFFTSHWGWTPFSTADRFPEPQAAALREFLALEDARQQELRTMLQLGLTAERALEVNYKWLQIWDRVSLDICRQSSQQPWAVQYPAVPAGYDSKVQLAVKLAMVAPGQYRLSPYPLLVDPFVAEVPSVSLDAEFASREQFLGAWRTARTRTVGAVISPA